MDIKVTEHVIGENSPVFIVAEAACNHMCDMDLAKKMIDRAADAGADAIKFQTYKAEKLVTKRAIAFWGNEKTSQLEYYKRLDRFGKKDYETLFSYATERKIIGFSSPFDKESADMLNEINMPVFKIASCEIPNLDFIKHVAQFGKPIILSTGASEIEEIDKAIETIAEQGNTQVILLACTLSYPTNVINANLLRIKTLKDKYSGMLVGLSDHTEPDENMIIPSIGVALGAKVIEKHYTIDRTMTGSGHFFAVDPSSLKKMVDNIRLTEEILGNGKLGVAESEKEAWTSARRSIVAQQPIGMGTVIKKNMLGVKRPGTGLSPDNMVRIVGKQAKINIPADEFITLDMVE